MSKDKRLGRGLAALLGDSPAADPAQPKPQQNDVIAFPTMDGDAGTEASVGAQTDPSEVQTATDTAPPDLPQPATAADVIEQENALPAGEAMLHLSVYEIDDNPFQPRRDFSESEISSLSESLKSHDMLQPVLVRRIANRYQLISGERRLRAAIQAGWKTVPARLREADDRLVAELAIVENLQRKDLNPIEKALSFRRYIDEHACTQDDLARRLKIDRSSIANLMRLLELPDEILRRLRDGSLSAGHARALLPLGEEHQQLDFCRRIKSEGWSVRATERNVQQKIQAEDGGVTSKKQKTKNRQVGLLEQELKSSLGAKVEIRQTGKRSGQIVIHFSSHEEFDRLRACLSESKTVQSNAG
jgi:ParB family chromosome partitioning protein